LIWSAKESALKAPRTGLRGSTCCLTVALLDQPSSAANALEIADSSGRSWRSLRVRPADGTRFDGRWCADETMVRTAVWIE
jgi:hypothetical protein